MKMDKDDLELIQEIEDKFKLYSDGQKVILCEEGIDGKIEVVAKFGSKLAALSFYRAEFSLP